MVGREPRARFDERGQVRYPFLPGQRVVLAFVARTSVYPSASSSSSCSQYNHHHRRAVIFVVPRRGRRSCDPSLSFVVGRSLVVPLASSAAAAAAPVVMACEHRYSRSRSTPRRFFPSLGPTYSRNSRRSRRWVHCRWKTKVDNFVCCRRPCRSSCPPTPHRSPRSMQPWHLPVLQQSSSSSPPSSACPHSATQSSMQANVTTMAPQSQGVHRQRGDRKAPVTIGMVPISRCPRLFRYRRCLVLLPQVYLPSEVQAFPMLLAVS